MVVRLFLSFLFCACLPHMAKTQSNTGLSCAADTFLDPASNSCVCNSNLAENANEIYITGIFDFTSYDWGYDIFKVTVDLINRGFWPNVKKENQVVKYDLANAECLETKAVRHYWDLRTSNGNRPMHGIIGARCSGPTTSLARISGVEGVPHLSPAAATARLSNDDEFPFFSRLVAPDDDRGEVGALIAMLRHFGWERVTILATDTLYAKDMATEFRKSWEGSHNDASGKWFGNVAYSTTIRLLPDGQVDPDSVQQALDGVPTNEPAISSRIILLMSHSQHAAKILKQARSEKFQPDSVWVGPSAWVARSMPRSDFGWLNTHSGFFGTTPFRNRDSVYQDFLKELQDYERANGKEITMELAAFAAEYVDAIRAMVTAISANTAAMRDGKAVVKSLRELSFDGVSGLVEFTPLGDRKDPQYSLFNSQGVTADGPGWVEIGTVGAGVGSATVQLEKACFAGFGCDLDKPPDDRDPIPRDKLPLWVISLIVIFPFLSIGIAIKYWRSRRSKKLLKSEIKVFRKTLLGMRAAESDYMPKIGKTNDTEQALSGSVIVAPFASARWCWQETANMMYKHGDDETYGDPADHWIKYDDTSNTIIEKAYQCGNTECFPLSGYKVDLSNMIQTKQSTGFQRNVQRELANSVVQDKYGGNKEIDLGKVKRGEALPDDLNGEPQMVLIAGDIVQISMEREDGWVFGTKLHHADEAAGRQLVIIATKGKSGEVDGDANVFVDSGWFPKDATHIPSSDELAILQKKVHTDGLDPPAHWDAIVDPAVVQKHEIPRGYKEYGLVVDAFMSSMARMSFDEHPIIIKVERIQNLSMYQSYIVKRQTICYRETSGDTDELAQQRARERYERCWLWHGCSRDVVDKILQQGFNRSFCGKNATAFGKGIYFARDAMYSANPDYSEPDFAGNQYVLACRVVVGEYCRGRLDALTPDIRDPATQSLYDSTVGIASDPLSDPSIYVTYHDAQAYPEYLITFQSTGVLSA